MNLRHRLIAGLTRESRVRWRPRHLERFQSPQNVLTATRLLQHSDQFPPPAIDPQQVPQGLTEMQHLRGDPMQGRHRVEKQHCRDPQTPLASQFHQSLNHLPLSQCGLKGPWGGNCKCMPQPIP